MSIQATTRTEVEYPSSDGEPMAETGIHVQTIMLLHQALQDFFRERPDVFIASDMFWYWVEGNSNIRVAPDVMVVPGVGNHHRRCFLSWEENAVPSIVFEMASAGTWKKDIGDKFDQYEELGVREYFMFDPEAIHLVPALQGYRLNGNTYRRLLNDDDTLESELGFRLRAEGTMLRLIDSRTGLPIPTRAEAVQKAIHEAASAQQEALRQRERAEALAAEVERLKAMIQQSKSSDGNGS